MKTLDLIDGLQLLQRYRAKKNSYDIGAEHDVIYAYATDYPLEHEAINRMIELGWHQEHDERDYDEEFSVKDYRPDESWIAHV